MNITIKINTDTPAFGAGANKDSRNEFARILRGIAENAIVKGLRYNCNLQIYDANGVEVGSIVTSKYDDNESA